MKALSLALFLIFGITADAAEKKHNSLRNVGPSAGKALLWPSLSNLFKFGKAVHKESPYVAHPELHENVQVPRVPSPPQFSRSQPRTSGFSSPSVSRYRVPQGYTISNNGPRFSGSAPLSTRYRAPSGYTVSSARPQINSNSSSKRFRAPSGYTLNTSSYNSPSNDRYRRPQVTPSAIQATNHHR